MNFFFISYEKRNFKNFSRFIVKFFIFASEGFLNFQKYALVFISLNYNFQKSNPK